MRVCHVPIDEARGGILVASDRRPGLLGASEIAEGYGLYDQAFQKIRLTTNSLARKANRFIVPHGAEMRQRQPSLNETHSNKAFADGDVVIIRDRQIFGIREVVVKVTTSSHQS